MHSHLLICLEVSSVDEKYLGRVRDQVIAQLYTHLKTASCKTSQAMHVLMV
jgi:hypothetical protein